MPIPSDYQIIQKTVKYARIRVTVDGTVRVTVPKHFSVSDLENFVERQKSWIEKNQALFRQKPRIDLGQNQLLLYGDRYDYYYDLSHPTKVSISHHYQTIRANINLLDIAIQESWYKSLAKQYLSNRTQELAKLFDFQYNKVYVRSQRTKYGSCSSLGNISLNWRLIKAPKFVIDYVILHELVHTRIMNHGDQFWLILKRVCPEYQTASDWLETYGHNL